MLLLLPVEILEYCFQFVKSKSDIRKINMVCSLFHNLLKIKVYRIILKKQYFSLATRKLMLDVLTNVVCYGEIQIQNRLQRLQISKLCQIMHLGFSHTTNYYKMHQNSEIGLCQPFHSVMIYNKNHFVFENRKIGSYSEFSDLWLK